MTRLQPIGALLTAAAATVLLSAPVVFADGGHRDNHRGHDGDERQVVVVQGAQLVVRDDRDDRDNDEVRVAPAQPVQVVEVEPEVNDVDDDND